jgi:hypothetical protein
MGARLLRCARNDDFELGGQPDRNPLSMLASSYPVRRIRTPQFCYHHDGAAKLIEIEAVSRRASEFQKGADPRPA